MTFYITTPLYYVNDLPHIGSAYPTMAADFIAGHMIQRGMDVCFLTGTDEHGQKIEAAAKAKGKATREHCDYIVEEFQKLWNLLEIKNDCFVRTSSDHHKEFVTEFYKKVKANGDIYKDKYTGLYCVSCEDFKLEKDLEESLDGDLICPTHKQKVEQYSQENYFFQLSKYEDKLKDYIEKNPDFICPEYRKNEVLSWLKEGLKDFPISRVGLEWGIQVPGDDNHDDQKIYVWFDALLGYISGLKENGLRDKYWPEKASEDSTDIVHIIGKDILRFHAIYWPAMLMSAGFPLPKKVFGHGFLTKDGMKMGKTLGNIVDPVELTKQYGSDAVRFYFLRELVFGRDGDFTEDGFITTVNSDLANNLGNLLNRCINLAIKNYDGKIPDAEFDPEIKKVFGELKDKFTSHMDDINPFFALEELFAALNKVNAYINDSAPWKLIKAGEVKEAGNYIYTGLEACRQAAIFLAPLCPELSIKIMLQLGIADEEKVKVWNRRQCLQTLFSYDDLQSYKFGDRILNGFGGVFQRIEKSEPAEPVK